MLIVLDTNIMTELMRPEHRANAAVLDWFSSAQGFTPLLNRISVTEIAAGGHGHPDPKQMLRIADYLRTISARYAVLEFDATASEHAAAFRGHRKLRGRPVSFADAAIAGICRAHDTALATRNIRDFEGAGIELVNPFSG